MYPPSQNVKNDTPQGNFGYPKLIINDEQSQQQKNESLQSEPNYNYPVLQQVQQPVYQPPQYQQPYQQLYQQPYQQPYHQPQQYQQPLLQQQQPIYINPQYNQVIPNIEQLNNQNNGQNHGQNKRFGVFVTCIWALQQLLDVLLIYYIIRHHTFPYQLGILCVILMFLIPLIVYKIDQKQSTAVSVFLFLAFVLSSSGATLGFIYLIGDLYSNYLLFQFFQFGTMTVAFFYLLNTHAKPQAKQLLKLTTLVLIINLTLYYFQVRRHIDTSTFIIYLIFNIIIWFFCCSLLSNMLVNTLDQIYQGKNKKIQRDNIWTGYILFKLYFYVPGA